ncbi:MAG: M50 family metallopeptidase [Candidatus Marsarchaeota archaeon]|jgi:hypothetical protein|nr:M50 family metallopeptidase [Candidatus Marsarchaeota archaeon]
MAKPTVKYAGVQKSDRKGNKPKKYALPKKYRGAAAVLAASLCLALLIYLAYSLPALGLAEKAGLAVILLAVSGKLIAWTLQVPGAAGLFILRTSRGVRFIERISRRQKRFWQALVDWGFVLSFGIFSLILFRRYVSRKMFLFGMLSILAMQLFVLPYTLVAIGLINTPQLSLQQSSSYVPSSAGIADYLSYAFVGLSLIGGFSLYLVANLVYIAVIIVHGIGAFLVAASVSAPAAHAAAGSLPGPAGVPVFAIPFMKPSIALPLILSLILLVSLHEMAHGVMLKRYGKKIKSVGTFLFGIIPLGAFVEPDERDVSRLPVKSQDKISIAGVSFNFFLSIIFFALMFAMLYYVLPGFTSTAVYIESVQHGAPAYNVIPAGAIVYKWNGYRISSIQDLEAAASSDFPGSTVSVATSAGNYSLTANATGKIGVLLGEEVIPTGGALSAAINFLYAFFALSFLLNFYVAIFNILPLPMLDGWRIYKLRMGRRSLMIVTAVALTVMVLLFVPWIWSL